MTLGIGDAAFALYYYPGSSGLFLKAGAGFSFVTRETLGENLEGVGWGFLGGVGYDLRVSRNVSLTPSASFYFGRPGDLKVERNTVITGWKQNVFDVGLGITFH